MSWEKNVSKEIVNGIVEDFTDRRGLRQEWEEIDGRLRAAIKRGWRKIVEDALAKPRDAE